MTTPQSSSVSRRGGARRIAGAAAVIALTVGGAVALAGPLADWKTTLPMLGEAPSADVADDTKFFRRPVVPTAALAPTLASLSDEMATLSEHGMQSVVSIAVRRNVEVGANPFQFGLRMPQQREQQGQGSGVIVDAEGLIMTNHHVVDSANEVIVSMADGSQYTAKVIGSDAATDIALVRLDEPPADLSPLELGDSDAVRPGQLTMAIGNPFGLSGSVSLGIVSATGRARMGITDYEDFIQTDTAINPGNSGGALIDVHGRLIGINTAIFSRSGGSQGIGFAVPSNMARHVMDQLIEHGEVTRGWLGVGIAEVPAKVAEALGIEDGAGVLISSVEPGGPAEQAGLRAGDVVLSLDGTHLDNVDTLRFRIAEMAPGTAPELEVARPDGRQRLDVALGERPSRDMLARQQSQRR